MQAADFDVKEQSAAYSRQVQLDLHLVSVLASVNVELFHVPRIIQRPMAVWTGIIVHKDEIFSDCSSIRFNIDIQNFLYVTFTSKRSVMEYFQVRFALPADGAPNHERSCTLILESWYYSPGSLQTCTTIG